MKKYLYLNENFVKHPTYSFEKAPEGKISGWDAYYSLTKKHKLWSENGFDFSWVQLVRLTDDKEINGKVYEERQYALLIKSDSDIHAVRKVLDKALPGGIIIDKDKEKVPCRLVSKEYEGIRHNKNTDKLSKIIMFKNKDYDVTEQIMYTSKALNGLSWYDIKAGDVLMSEAIKFTEDLEVENAENVKYPLSDERRVKYEKIMIKKHMVGELISTNNIDYAKAVFNAYSGDYTYYIEYTEDIAQIIKKIPNSL